MKGRLFHICSFSFRFFLKHRKWMSKYIFLNPYKRIRIWFNNGFYLGSKGIVILNDTYDRNYSFLSHFSRTQGYRKLKPKQNFKNMINDTFESILIRLKEMGSKGRKHWKNPKILISLFNKYKLAERVGILHFFKGETELSSC